MGEKDKKIVIIGAGLVGALVAVSLAQKGYNVTVYERYVDIRSIPSLGRSINLVLTSRGLRAIASISRDLVERMLKLSVRVMGRQIHVGEGEGVFQRYGKDDTEFNYSISRFELNVFLINAAEEAGATLHFNHKVDGVDFDGDTVTMIRGQAEAKPQMIGGGVARAEQQTAAAGREEERITIPFDHLFGCDGGGSAVRYAMRAAGLTDFYEEFINSGYKELIFPAKTPGSNPSMEANRLHIWPHRDHFLMTLADVPGTFTGTFYLPFTGQESFETLTTDGAVRTFFRRYYKECFALMADTEKEGEDEMVRQFMANPVGHLGSVRCHTFNADGKVLLLGDAAHAMVPFFGQGTNCGFEDVLELTSLWQANGCTFDKSVFDRFDFLRRPNTWAIQNMAMENFLEMQSRVAESEFQLIKDVENVIEQHMPDLYRSRYAMVCYGGRGNVTYSNAYRIGVVQEEIRKELARELVSKGLGAQGLDLARVRDILTQRLLPLQRSLKIDLSTVNHEYWQEDDAEPSRTRRARL